MSDFFELLFVFCGSLVCWFYRYFVGILVLDDRIECMRALCVFCGANFGRRLAYRLAAERVGSLLAQRGITLVYGGGKVGLMGALADAALAGGGRVVGVIPRALAEKEIAHTGLSEMHV